MLHVHDINLCIPEYPVRCILCLYTHTVKLGEIDVWGEIDG